LPMRVLRRCVNDMLFFMVSFGISMAAFSMMLCVQLGHTMAAFIDNFTSFVSISRALFGDFDIDEIMNNSPDYLNTIVFIGYLFVAIFILLSMFLALLAEAQVEVRGMEEDMNGSAGTWGEAKWNDEYGLLSASGRAIHRNVCGAKRVRQLLQAHVSLITPAPPAVVAPAAATADTLDDTRADDPDVHDAITSHAWPTSSLDKDAISSLDKVVPMRGRSTASSVDCGRSAPIVSDLAATGPSPPDGTPAEVMRQQLELLRAELRAEIRAAFRERDAQSGGLHDRLPPPSSPGERSGRASKERVVRTSGAMRVR